MKNKIYKLIALFLIISCVIFIFYYFFILSDADKNAMQNSFYQNAGLPAIKQALVQQIINARTMEDIFYADTVNLLQIPEEHLIGAISAVHVGKTGRIFVVDEIYTNTILAFDQNGQFLRKIGKTGKGPGEFMSPRHVSTNNQGEIIVSDMGNFRVSLFDSNGIYLHSFPVPKLLQGMTITAKDEIIIHDQDAMKMSSDCATIFVYNRQGELLFQCGSMSTDYRALKNIPVWVLGLKLACDGDSLFEMDYADYHIRKFWNRGKSKTEFGIKPDRWKSLIATNYKKLPGPQMMTPAIQAQLSKYMKNEFYQSSRIVHIQSLSSGILMVMLADKLTGDIREDNYFCFYDTQGNLLRQGLTFHQFSTEKKDSLLNVLVPVSPAGLCIVQMEMPLDSVGYTRLIFLYPLKNRWER